jgi:prepilin signal peptidase PulO-like enzyme (type II secretory pathway)
MNFIFNIAFWFLCAPLLIIVAISVLTSMHPNILNKKPKAVALNNLMILIGFGLLISIFIVYSWLAGIFSIVLSIVIIGVTGRIRERIFMGRIIKNESESKESSKNNL